MAVFVHSALETNRLWDRVLPPVDENLVALRLPGHSTFAATKDGCAAWLAAAIGQLAAPVDLVGGAANSLIQFWSSLER